jgi:hypothetical protein
MRATTVTSKSINKLTSPHQKWSLIPEMVQLTHALPAVQSSPRSAVLHAAQRLEALGPRAVEVRDALHLRPREHRDFALSVDCRNLTPLHMHSPTEVPLYTRARHAFVVSSSAQRWHATLHRRSEAACTRGTRVHYEGTLRAPTAQPRDINITTMSEGGSRSHLMLDEVCKVHVVRKMNHADRP